MMKKNRPLYLFLIKSAALFVLWQFIYHAWITRHTNLEMWLTSQTAAVTTGLLNIVGYSTDYNNFPGELGSQSYSQVILDGKPLLGIADSCNALTLMVLFIGFIVAYPGHLLYKLIFISLGSILIFGINVLRSLTLILNYLHNQSSFDFNHKYTFTIIVYLVVFAFWMYWAFIWSNKKPKFLNT